MIHPSAIIETGAKIGKDVTVGPFSFVGKGVELKDGVILESHAVVTGNTVVGKGTHIFPFAAIGHIPQDLKFEGEPSKLIIGENNRIREHVTMHPGTKGDNMTTVVGNNNLFMVGSHVAHDCVIGNNVVMANNATLAGHVKVEDFAIIGGLSAVHQFVRIGAHAMIGGMSGVENDVIPFGMVFGDRARLAGLNVVGLRRRGFDREKIHELRKAYRLLFAQEGTMSERLRDVSETFSTHDGVSHIINFIKEKSKREVCLPKVINEQ